MVQCVMSARRHKPAHVTKSVRSADGNWKTTSTNLVRKIGERGPLPSAYGNWKTTGTILLILFLLERLENAAPCAQLMEIGKLMVLILLERLQEPVIRLENPAYGTISVRSATKK